MGLKKLQWLLPHFLIFLFILFFDLHTCTRLFDISGYLEETKTECVRSVPTLDSNTCTNTGGLSAASYYQDFRVVKVKYMLLISHSNWTTILTEQFLCFIIVFDHGAVFTAP